MFGRDPSPALSLTEMWILLFSFVRFMSQLTPSLKMAGGTDILSIAASHLNFIITHSTLPSQLSQSDYHQLFQNPYAVCRSDG
jgi:uncharacterized membrane protein